MMRNAEIACMLAFLPKRSDKKGPLNIPRI